jgi:hypothetical protein
MGPSLSTLEGVALRHPLIFYRELNIQLIFHENEILLSFYFGREIRDAISRGKIKLDRRQVCC